MTGSVKPLPGDGQHPALIGNGIAGALGIDEIASNDVVWREDPLTTHGIRRQLAQLADLKDVSTDLALKPSPPIGDSVGVVFMHQLGQLPLNRTLDRRVTGVLKLLLEVANCGLSPNILLEKSRRC